MSFICLRMVDLPDSPAPRRSILISFRRFMRSRFSWFSISSFRALPSLDSELAPHPIVADVEGVTREKEEVERVWDGRAQVRMRVEEVKEQAGGWPGCGRRAAQRICRKAVSQWKMKVRGAGEGGM